MAGPYNVFANFTPVRFHQVMPLVHDTSLTLLFELSICRQSEIHVVKYRRSTWCHPYKLSEGMFELKHQHISMDSCDTLLLTAMVNSKNDVIMCMRRLYPSSPCSVDGMSH